MDLFWTAVSTGAAVFSALNVTPQIYKSWRTKRTADLSWGALLMVMGGNVLWIAHSIHNRDLALGGANVFLLVTACGLAALKARYDPRGVNP